MLIRKRCSHPSLLRLMELLVARLKAAGIAVESASKRRVAMLNETKKALVIGIGNYKGGAALPNPPNDACGIGAPLRALDAAERACFADGGSGA